MLGTLHQVMYLFPAAKAKYIYSDEEEGAPKFSDSEDEQPAPKITNGAGAKDIDDFTPSASPPR